ncbi:MAG: hypothetical protein KDA25_00415 [Phycisphaerales bacterium]|nr:hypothetical protein [Phycisphaerales bacterium]
MSHGSISARASIRRFFESGFTVMDVAESLASFDDERDGASIRAFMTRQDFDVVGVRVDGSVVGYVERDALAAGPCRDSIRYFGTNQLLGENDSIRDAIRALDRTPCVFVTGLGQVSGIVTRHDLEKTPVRMWLFGLVSVLEEVFSIALRREFDGTSWTQHLPATRLNRARDLQRERRRRNQSPDLVDCLHFSDKGHVLFKDDDIRAQFGFESRNHAKKRLLEIERLRNSLAHVHDIVDHSWDTITLLATSLDTILRLCDRYQFLPETLAGR